MSAATTQTERFQAMSLCANAGTRTIGYSASSSRNFAVAAVNGTAIAPNVTVAAGGQITIGSWQNAGTSCCDQADVLAVIVFNRAVTAADFKQVHRRYCELLGQARPGGATARDVIFLGDSLTAGYTDG